MVNRRGRTDIQTEKEIEAFAAQAEKPMTPVTALPKTKPLPSPTARAAVPDVSRVPAISPALSPALSDWKRRNREPKTGGINFRASSSQLDLLRQAALMEEISQQKVLERLVWPLLEEKYGTGSSE